VETQKALRQLGVCADVVGDGEPRDWAGCDLVHLFNIQSAENALNLLRRAKAAGKPVVLSTIWWDFRYTRHLDNLRYGDKAFWAVCGSAMPRLAMLLHRVRSVRWRRRWSRLQRELLQKADLILPNSVAELEILVAQYSLPELRARAVIVPNGVNPVALASREPSERLAGLPERFVLMAAGFTPIKGQARLIEALMGERQIPLVCAGHSKDGRYGRHCQELAARRGNTYLFDNIRHEEMPQLYRRAKVHALPSMRESPGLATLEAAVCGANCVVGIHGPVQEYFGMDCFLCDPMDPESVRSAVLAAWNGPPNERLKARILKDFTWQRAAEETLRGYEWILHERTSGVPERQQQFARTTFA